MERIRLCGLALASALMLGSAGKALAQYDGTFVWCTDGSSSAACAATAVDPDPETGIVTWSRALYGALPCAAAGIVPQDTDCNVIGESFQFFNCNPSFGITTFLARVPAGDTLAVACADEPVPPGNYSARAINNSCFGGASVCGNLSLVVE